MARASLTLNPCSVFRGQQFIGGCEERGNSLFGERGRFLPQV
jgi:hypothetical protein